MVSMQPNKQALHAAIEICSAQRCRMISVLTRARALPTMAKIILNPFMNVKIALSFYTCCSSANTDSIRQAKERSNP